MDHAGRQIGYGKLVVLVAAQMALSALAISSILPALPQIDAALNLSVDNHRQWIITTYLLGFGGAQLAYGPFADRYGRKPLLLIGTLGYAVFSVFAAFATSMESMLAMRFLQGAGAAAARVASMAMVRDSYSGAPMARVMSHATAVFLTVSIVAPSLGQALLLIASWHWIFVAPAIVSIALAAWCLLRVPETLRREHRRPVSTKSMGEAFQLILDNPLASGYMLAMALATGIFHSFTNSIQQLLADTFNTPHLLAPIFALMGLCIAVASILNARIVSGIGLRRVSHAALLCLIHFAVLHTFVALLGHETLLTFLLLQAGTLFCLGMMMANFSALAMQPLGHIAATASSVQGFIIMVGGGLLSSLVSQQFDGTVVPLLLGTVIFGLACLVIALIVERGRLFQLH